MVWINSAETDGDHEQHGEDHFVNGAAGVHQAANGLVNPPRHQVFGAHQTEGDGENHRQRGAPDGDLQRDGHFGEVILPLAEIGREEVGGEGCHVAAVFDQRKRGHFRALPRDDQHGENNGPAQKREPAALGWGDGDGLHVWLRDCVLDRFPRPFGEREKTITAPLYLPNSSRLTRCSGGPGHPAAPESRWFSPACPAHSALYCLSRPASL